MDGARFPYQRNHEYVGHSQLKRREMILKPAECDSENGFMIISPRQFQLNSDVYGDHEFLRHLSALALQPAPYSSVKQVWSYESRQEAQAVLPFLFLGPTPVAQNSAWISAHGITMAVAVRSAQSAKKLPKWMDPAGFTSCQQNNVETATLDVDSPADVISQIKPILKQMNDHLKTRQETPIGSLEDVRGKILVFCESGNGRSPVLVAAYLMLVWRLTWADSLNFVHAFRFSIGVDASMNSTLKTLEGMLEAENDTAAVSSGMTGMQGLLYEQATTRGSKRTLDDSYDSDDTMAEDFEPDTRPGIAPFEDKS